MARKRARTTAKGIVPADPDQWSEKSKQSYSYHYTKEYKDIAYKCWRCGKEEVFTAEDQKYTYEVKKAYIDQQRILCHDCWKQSLEVANDIRKCEQQWAESKEILRNDPGFLSKWLELLESRDEYVPYGSNTAAKSMLKKLLSRNA